MSEPGPPDRYQEQSSFFVGPVSPTAIATAFSWARRWPGTTEGAHLVLFQTGDQINAMAPDATAFVHRDSDWLMTIALTWGANDSPANVEQNLDWQDAFYGAMRAFTVGSYVNFPDPSLTSWAIDYYDDNLPRLQRIKAQVDPDQVFRFAQSIEPAASTAADFYSRTGTRYGEPGPPRSRQSRSAHERRLREENRLPIPGLSLRQAATDSKAANRHEPDPRRFEISAKSLTI